MDTTNQEFRPGSKPTRPIPSMMAYLDLRIDTMCRLTSANPGGSCTSASAPGIKAPSTDSMPNYANDAIARKIAREVGCTFEQAVELLRDTSNFLWLASKSSDVCVPSPIIDETWHVFILFTAEYIDFCNKYCGGYVHHAPHTGPEIRMTLDYIRPTADLIHVHFGKKPNGNWDYISVLAWQEENRLAA